jgi:hypothetical protein
MATIVAALVVLALALQLRRPLRAGRSRQGHAGHEQSTSSSGGFREVIAHQPQSAIAGEGGIRC